MDSFFQCSIALFLSPRINRCTITAFLLSAEATGNLWLCLLGYIFFIWGTKSRIFASWCGAAAAAEHLPSHTEWQRGKVWDTNKRAVSGSHFNFLGGKLAARLWASFPGLPLTRGTGRTCLQPSPIPLGTVAIVDSRHGFCSKERLSSPGCHCRV